MDFNTVGLTDNEYYTTHTFKFNDDAYKVGDVVNVAATSGGRKKVRITAVENRYVFAFEDVEPALDVPVMSFDSRTKTVKTVGSVHVAEGHRRAAAVLEKTRGGIESGEMEKIRQQSWKDVRVLEDPECYAPLKTQEKP